MRGGTNNQPRRALRFYQASVASPPPPGRPLHHAHKVVTGPYVLGLAWVFPRSLSSAPQGPLARARGAFPEKKERKSRTQIGIF